MKRYFALLLSVLMVLGTVGFPVAVSALELPLEQENLPDKKVVVKFDDAMVTDWKGMEAGAYEEADGSWVTAAKMAPGALNANGQRSSKDYPNPRYWFEDNGIDTDMSGYRTVNFRLYSKAATNEKVNIVLQQTKTWGDGYFMRTVTLDWVGWKTISYDFGDISPSKAGISEKRVGTIYFNFGGWSTNTTGNAETELAVSEIYLTNPHNEVKLEDGLIVWEAGTTENCAPFTSDSSVTNMHDVSGKMIIDKTGAIDRNTPNRHLVVDAEEYKYLNLLVYSSKATEQPTSGLKKGINVCAYLYPSNKYMRRGIPIDWEGWKLVSLPIANFSKPTDVENPWTQIKYIKINANGWQDSILPVDVGTELNFDLIWFSKEEPSLKLQETIAQAGNTEMPATGAGVSFRFSNPLRRIDETKLTLTKQGETNSESISCMAEGSTMTLAAQGTLEYGTAYTLTVPSGAVTDIFGQSNTEPITYNFTTMQQGLNVSPPTLTDSAGNPLTAMPENGETVKAATRISNGASAAKTATLVLACYDENNRMLDCKTVSKSIPANGADTLETTTAAAGAAVKVFVLDDLGSQQPLYNGFVQLPSPALNGGSEGSGGTPALSLTGIRLEEEKVYINGKVDGALPRMEIIAINGETTEEPLFLSPIMAEDGGAFTMETTMPETATSGEYEIRATAYGIEGKQTDTIRYINKNDRDALIADINAAETAETVADLLTEKRDILGLPQDGALFTHIAQTIFEQKSYESYAALITMLEQAQTVLAKLNAATGTEYSKLLSENSMILNGHADEAYYNDLSVAGKTAVNRRIVPVAPFESFVAFRTAFEQAVAAYKQDLESSGVKLEDGLVVWEFDSEEKCTLVNLTPDSTLTNMHDVSGKMIIDKTGDISGSTPSRDLAVDTQQYQYLNLVMHSNKATTTSGTGINLCIHDSSSYARAVLPVNWTGWKVVSVPLSAFAGTIDWNDVKYVKINSGGWSGSVKPVELGTELNFDLIWFSKEEPNLTLEETITQAGNTEMPVTDAAVSFWFSNPLRAVDETRLTLTKQGETNSESISCTVEGSSVTLEAQAELDYGTTYTLTIPSGAVTDIFGQNNETPITYSFTTLKQGLNATLPALTDSAGNPLSSRPTGGETIKAATRVSNGASEAKTATLVLVCYDENNRVLVRKAASKSIPANGTDTLEVTAAASGAVIKAFVVDELASMQPLYNGFVQVPSPTSNGGSAGSGENLSLSLTGVRLEEEQVYITGKVDGALPRMAIIAIDGETTEEPLFLSPIMAEDGGAFTVETTMPETAAGGEYEVRATAYNIEGKQTDTFYYFGKEERDALVAAVNAAEAVETVTELLTEKRDIFGLPQDGVLFTHIARTVFEQKPYANYAAFTTMLEQTQTVLAELNAATNSEYSKLLSENPMILNGHEDEAYYNDLSVAGKTAVNQKIISSAPFESFAAFRTVFARAVAAYKQELESGSDSEIERENLPDKKVIVKFDDAMIADWQGMAQGSYTETDGSRVTAAKMAPGALNASGERASRDYPNPKYFFEDHGIDTDMSGYRTINFRMYSKKKTNEKVNIILQQTKNFDDGYFSTQVTLDWEGWKTISVNFGDLTPQKVTGISENSVASIYFNFGGWGANTTGNAETELAVSEIYLSNPYNEVKLEDGLIVWEFDSEDKCTLPQFTPDSTLTNMHDVSGKFVIDRTTNLERNTPNRHLVVDAEEYQYLNLLVHSNKATTTERTGLNLCIYDYAGNNSYVRKTLPIDWTGWKVVSIPLSQINYTRWSQVKYIKINSGGWADTIKPVEVGTELNFDLIWFSKEEPNLKLKETITPAGNTEMPAIGTTVSFRFSNPLRSVNETKLTLTKQGETNSESVSGTLKGSAVTLTAWGALEYSTTYTLTVPTGAVTDIFGQSNEEPITYSFTTQGRGLSAMRPTLTDSIGIPLSNMPASGETVKSSVQVNNGLDEEKTATLVVAFYDENNCMLDYKTVSKSIPANGADTLTLTAPAIGAAVKAFVLDDLGSQQPLYNGFVQAPPASNGGTIGSGAQNKSLTLNSVKLEGDRLSIEGKVEGELPCAAVISVGGGKLEKPLFLSPIMAENGGTFTMQVTLPETADSGEYEVCVTARGIESKQTETIHYVNRKEREALISAVNTAETPEKIVGQLENHRVSLGLPEDIALIAHVAQTVFEQKPYADYAAFTSVLEQAQTVLAELNAATWAEYSKLLSENPMILNGHADEAYYNNLSAAGKAEINRKIVLSAPFKSFAVFRTTFAQAVADYKKGLESGNGGGSSGGSGGSAGGGRPGATSIGQVTLPSGTVPPTPNNTIQKPENNEARFTDLTEAEWARDSVERLYAAGAVSAAVQFRPNDSVTREEFVKLMVESFGLTKDASAAEFTDVAADSWYARYVAIVQSMGIVTGYEDGRFGVGEQITRQDMAVMLSRMLEILDVKLPEGNAKPFIDDGEISGYAHSAVYLMRQAGVINGHDDGSFGPLQNASRAQAAKVLCGLLDLLAR